MASGKKNYFRHSFFARNDMKLLQLKDEIGIGYYFYYFSLLELCGEQAADEFRDEFEFHDSLIRSLWRINLKKSERIANKMHSVCLLEFEKREKSFYFKIPNLSKYLGKYTIKNDSNSSNKKKRKENKIKENKIKETNADKPKDSASLLSFDEFIRETFNTMLGDKFPKILKISAKRKNQIAICKKNLDLKTKNDWLQYFEIVKETKFLHGDNDRGWQASFDWLIKQDNALKVLEGSYRSAKKQTPQERAGEWLEKQVTITEEEAERLFEEKINGKFNK